MTRRAGSRLAVALLVLVPGCTGPPAFPINLVVRIFNHTHVPGSFHYEGQGTSGDQPIATCGNGSGTYLSETDFVLGPGTWQLTVKDGSASATVSEVAPATGMAYVGYVIEPGGTLQLAYRNDGQHQEPTEPPSC